MQVRLEVGDAGRAGDLDLDTFRQPDLPTPDLRTQLLRIKGIGPYAAATLLTLLGHFDHLAVDSWTRKLVIPRYFPDRSDVTDAGYTIVLSIPLIFMPSICICRRPLSSQQGNTSITAPVRGSITCP